MTRFADSAETPPGGPSRRTYDRSSAPAEGTTAHDHGAVYTLHQESSQQQDPTLIWNGVREELRASLPASAFQHWLEPLRAVGAQGGRLYVSGPERVREWFQRRYGETATEVLRRRAPQFSEIAFTDPPAPGSDSPTTAAETGDLPSGVPPGLAANLD